MTKRPVSKKRQEVLTKQWRTALALYAFVIADAKTVLRCQEKYGRAELKAEAAQALAHMAETYDLAYRAKVDVSRALNKIEDSRTNDTFWTLQFMHTEVRQALEDLGRGRRRT